MSIKAIIFDLDGTLLDTLDDIADSMNVVLAARGAPTHPRESYKLFVGDGIEMLVRRALPPGHTEEAVREALAAMRETYGACGDVETRPYEGVPELLDALVTRDVSLLVLSNKAEELTQPIVERLLARWTFLEVRGAREGVPRKPDPTAVRELIDAHALDATAMLYVGDTSIDMRTAKAAGLPAVGVTWGFRGEDELRESGADHIIHAPAELLKLL